MLQGEHSAILSTFIKLPFVIKIFVLFIFKTDFTVLEILTGLICSIFFPVIIAQLKRTILYSSKGCFDYTDTKMLWVFDHLKLILCLK